MIKMFGWEKKVEAQVQEKRETELQYTWKYFLCGIVQTNVKYVPSKAVINPRIDIIPAP